MVIDAYQPQTTNPKLHNQIVKDRTHRYKES